MKIVSKKSIAVVLSLMLVVSCCMITALAAGEATISVQSVNVQAGETVDVAITVKNNPGIAGMTLGIDFDSEALTLKEIKDGGILGVNTHKPELTSPYTLSWSNDTITDNITSNGVIATLSFEAKENAAGEYPITLSYDYENYDIYNVNIEKVSFKIQSGCVTVGNSSSDYTTVPAETSETTEPASVPVTAAQIVAQSVTAKAGETIDVNITVNNNPGIAGMTLDVMYDKSALTLSEVIDGGILGENAHKPELKSPYTLSWSNDTIQNNIKANGTIATLRFNINENAAADDYPIVLSYDYDNYDIYNADIQAVRFETVNGTVTVKESASAVLTGDTNGDGAVTIDDATTIQKHLAQLITLEGDALKAADTNGDGAVTIDDATQIQKYLAQMIDSLG